MMIQITLISFVSLTVSNGKFSSQVTYWLIGFFFLLAIILGIIQCLRRISFSNVELCNEIEKFIDKFGITDDQVILNYVDSHFAKQFLTYDEYIRFLINSLTILGLLGTFIGLAALIVPHFNELSNALNQGQYSDQLFSDVMSNITGGFKTAFYTSITGIICSLICSILYNIYRQNIRTLKTKFIDQYLPAIVKSKKEDKIPYDPVALYNEIQSYFIEGLKKFEEVNLQSHNKLMKWGEEVISSHTQMVENYVEANNKRIQSVTDELIKEYYALNKIAKDNLKIATILENVLAGIDSFIDIIKNYNTNYENLLNKIGEFSQNFGDLFSNMNSIVASINQPSLLLTNLYNSIQQMVNNQNEIPDINKQLLENAQESLERMEQMLKEHQQGMKNTIEQSLTDIPNKISDALKIIDLLSENQANICANTNIMKESISPMSLSLKLIENLINNIDQIANRLDKLNRNLGSVLTNLLE